MSEDFIGLHSNLRNWNFRTRGRLKICEKRFNKVSGFLAVTTLTVI